MKNSSFLAILFFLGILFSCNQIMDKPKNLIPEDKMSQIIVDFILTNQAISIYPHLHNTNDKKANTQYIFEKHKVKAEDFSTSQMYYVSKPEKMKKIYEKAQEIITKNYPEFKKVEPEK